MWKKSNNNTLDSQMEITFGLTVAVGRYANVNARVFDLSVAQSQRR